MSSFGGTVKLTGEAEYRKALTQITQSLRETSSALNLVDSEYAKNDNSVATATAKNEKLNAILDKQKTAYEGLKNSFTNIKAKYDEQVNAHNKLQAEYDEEKSKLETLKNTVGENSSAYEKQKAKVGELATQLSKSQQNIDANEVAMSKLRTQMNNAEATINKTSNEIDDLGKELDDTTEKTKSAGDGFTIFKGILANLGTQAINTAINGIKKLGSAVVNVGKQAIESYADYEQLIGGVETLFKDSAGVVEGYANNAYKTAGLSANEYMETVTSFSASLINSLDGDTKKAAELSNVAITDMSDNANKMGTDIEMLQNAYSGFARGNYTMLDNLKLGFSGSKEGMQQLLDKANEYNASIGKNTNYQISSYADIVNAIHDVQTQMDITGTTAKEASSTISGSANAMKSAWSNLLTGMADDNANFDQLIQNLVDSVITFGDNIIPRIQTTITGIAKMLTGLLKEVVPKIIEVIPPLIIETLPMILNAVQTVLTSVIDTLPQIVDALSGLIPQVVAMILSMLPQLLDTGIQMIVSLIKGITEALPQLIAMIPDIIIQMVNTLLDNLPMIIQTGIELLVTLITGLSEAIPQLIDYIPTIITTIVEVLLDNLPLIVDAAIQIMVALINGLVQSLPKLITMVPRIIMTIVSTLINNIGKIYDTGAQILKSLGEGISSMIGNLGATIGNIVKSIINWFINLPGEMANTGRNIIQGLINGVKNMASNAIEAVKDVGRGILNGIKGVLGIHSPSKVFRDQIGKNLALGLEEGFTNEMKNVTSEMQSAIPTNFDVNGSYNNVSSPSNINYQDNYYSIVEAFKTALGQMKIELDDDEMGKFVDKTVARTIYS